MAKDVITGDDVLKGVVERIKEAHDEFTKFTKEYYAFSKSLSNIKNGAGATDAITQSLTLDEKKVKLLTQITRLEKEKANAIAASERASKAALQTESTAITLENKKLANKKKTNELSAQEKYDQQQKNRLLKEDLALQSKYSTELKKAQIIRNGVAKVIQDLNVKQALGNKLTKEETALLKKSQAEFKKYDSAVRGAEESVGRFNSSVGNYKKGLQGLVGVGKSFVAAFGVYSGIQIVKDIFEQVKQIEALDLALSKVTKNQEEFNQTQLFIQDIARFTGVGLITLTDSYKRFRGSIEGSNIELEQAQRIFERFSKASAILGSSTDETNGVLRALGQIISKGKVQAEELRGQLGDRLSGAFGLMAKAIGVTTAELDKMIEQGEVTSDTLIKLAETVGDTFGVDTVTSIDTINAAIGRLNTSWILLLKSFEDGSGPISETFKEVLGVITDLLDKITEFNKGGDIRFDEGKIQGAKVALESVRDEADKFNISVQEAAEKIIPRYNKILSEWATSLGDITKAQSESALSNTWNIITGKFDEQQASADEALKKIGLYTKALEVLKDISENGLSSDSLTKEIAKPIDTLASLRAQLAELVKELEVTEINTPAFSKLQTEISILEKRIESLTKKSKGGIQDAIKGTIAYYTQLIKEEKDFQTNEATTQEAIRQSMGVMEEYQKEIDKLIGAYAKLEKIDVKFFGFGDTGSPEERFKELLKPFEGIFDTSMPEDFLKATSDKALEELNRRQKAIENGEKAVTKLMQDEANTRSKIFGEMFASFSNFYGLDLTAFEDLIKGKTFLETDWAATANSVVAAFYDGKFASYEEDENRNRATLNAILNDSQASDKKKEQAQIEYDKKERKLQQQKAKAAKDEALFQIAISTAVAVVKSLPNYAQAIAVAALGGIQAGIVASRKIPQFFKGTDYAPRGWAWTDEKGAEIHTDRRGKIKDFGSNDGPRLKFLESGDKIFTAEKSKQLLNTEIFNSTDNIKHLMAQRLASDTNQRAAMFAVNSGVDSKEIGRAVERAISKYADRPLKIYNNVTYSKPRTRY